MVLIDLMLVGVFGDWLGDWFSLLVWFCVAGCV